MLPLLTQHFVATTLLRISPISGFLAPMLSRAREICIPFRAHPVLSNTGWMCAPPCSYRTHQSCPTATSWLTWHVLSKMSLLPTRTSVVVSNQLPRPPYKGTAQVGPHPIQFFLKLNRFLNRYHCVMALEYHCVIANMEKE